MSFPSFKQYLVEEQREVFFTFGRMNPPTTGHGKLLDVLSTKAGRNPYKVYLSKSQDAKKNPLSYDQKIKHARKMFPKHGRNIIKSNKIRNVFEVAAELYGQGFNRLTMVVGADRVMEFSALLNKYNGTKARHGFYVFESIKVISAGDRDPDADDVTGMSASKQRANAASNDFTTFSQGVPSGMSAKDTKRLFNDVRTGMGLKETTSFRNHVDLGSNNATREKYIEGELFNEGDQVRTRSGKTGSIHRLGSNYVIVALDEGRIARHWIEDVELIEKTDDWYKDQPEWGKPAATKHGKKVTPGQNVKEDEVKVARNAIDREVNNDKRKFDRMLDRARLARAIRKNRGLPAPGSRMKASGQKTTEAADKMNGVKFDPRDEVTFRKRHTEGMKNPVAKHARKFNKAAVHTDKKKAQKKGYVKHKKDINK